MLSVFIAELAVFFDAAAVKLLSIELLEFDVVGFWLWLEFSPLFSTDFSSLFLTNDDSFWLLLSFSGTVEQLFIWLKNKHLLLLNNTFIYKTIRRNEEI